MGTISTVNYAKDILPDNETTWKRPSILYLGANAVLVMFVGSICKGMVIKNVNWGPKITHLRLV